MRLSVVMACVKTCRDMSRHVEMLFLWSTDEEAVCKSDAEGSLQH